MNNLRILEGQFGKVEFDCSRPSIGQLWLRQQDGSLSDHNLLSLHSPYGKPWAIGGYSYVITQEGTRYESRNSVGHSVVENAQGLRLDGIRLTSSDGMVMPTIESWDISIVAGDLHWRVERNWTGVASYRIGGSPALFFNGRPNNQGFLDLPPGKLPELSTAWRENRIKRAAYINPTGNGVATAIWFAEKGLKGSFDPLYFTGFGNQNDQPSPMFSRNPCISVLDRDAWAVIKCFTNFPIDSDLRLAVQGHLYRRGAYDRFSEIGIIPILDSPVMITQIGHRESTSLHISSQSKMDTGYQLAIDLPDPSVQKPMQRFYDGMINAACMTDQKIHDIGNEVDGFMVPFTPNFAAYAASAGIPGPRILSSQPLNIMDAIRSSLDRRFNALGPHGEVMWGFTHDPEKPMLESQSAMALAAEQYLQHTGDTDWGSRCFPELERIMDFCKRNADGNDGLLAYGPDRTGEKNQGLSATPEACPNWYFDGIRASGTLAYHNVFYYGALLAMARFAAAIGRSDRADSFTIVATALRDRFNQIFWKENAFGSGQSAYLDWVEHGGREHCYFVSAVQYPAIVFGLASPDQARQIISTADRRLAILAVEYGYQGDATPDCLWPIPPELLHGNQESGFGYYMNGGMLPTWTYWEIVARTRSLDFEGAYQRLRRFASHAARTNWFEGENSFTLDGRPYGWGSEPYLSDQMTVPASIIDGFMGVKRDWSGLTATPALPSIWPYANAVIIHKGKRWRIEIKDDHVDIFPFIDSDDDR